jgi:hypothetical protein
VRLALGDAGHLRGVQGVELVLVVAPLRQQLLDPGQHLGEVGGDLRPGFELAPDVAEHPAEVGLEPSDLAPRPLHLAGVGVAAGQAQRLLAEPGVALAQGHAMALGQADQGLAAAMIQPGIEGMGDRLGLDRGVDADPLKALLFDRFAPPSRGDRLLQQQLDAVLADAPAPADQRARIDRYLELQVIEAAEVLPVRILDPARDHLLVGEAKGVLQVAEPDHQPDRDARPAHVRVIEWPEPRLEHFPVEQAGEPHQRVAGIKLLAEAGAEQVVGRVRIGLGRTHRNRQISTAGGQPPAIYNIWWRPKIPKIQSLAAFSGPTN